MSERLDGLRVALGTDWGGLAEKLGISRSMLGFLRSGERLASPKLMRRISDTEAPATADLRKRAAELTERLELLRTIDNAEKMIGLFEVAVEAREEARKAKADALAAEERLRLERNTISASKADAV